MDINEHIVDFAKWCPECKHLGVKDEHGNYPEDAPCDECLGYPTNFYTDKPRKWIKK